MSPVEKSCDQCGQSFNPRRKDQKYCSRQCKNRSSYARNRQVAQRICPQCGNEIPPESHANMDYCSRRCRQQFHQEANTGQSNPLEHNDTPVQPLPKAPIEATPPHDTDSLPVEQHLRSPIESPTYTPTELIKKLCDRASEYEFVTVDTFMLNVLLEAMDPTPAAADEILTDEVKGCVQTKPGTCIITASFFEEDNLTHKIPDVISAIKKEGIRSFTWERVGDLVFVLGDESPEWTAIQVRDIMLNVGGCKSIRLRRGYAWGHDDWKPRYYDDEPLVPNGWCDSYWTG